MRLAFSVAINVDADILLIDEILSVGDQNFSEKVHQQIAGNLQVRYYDRDRISFSRTDRKTLQPFYLDR